MKPTTQAKTPSQLCNQIEALLDILDVTLAGTSALDMSVCRDEVSGGYLHEILTIAKNEIKIAHSIAVSRAGDEYKAKTKARNEKYAYLRQEYYAKRTTNSYSAKRALQSAAAGRAQLKAWQEEQKKRKAQMADDKYVVAAAKRAR